MGIATGEHPLDGNEVKRNEGAQVRTIGIPVASGRRGGIFNRVKDAPEKRAKICTALAQSVEDTIANNYGVAMPAFLAHIVPRKNDLSEPVRAMVSESVVWVERAARSTNQAPEG